MTHLGQLPIQTIPSWPGFIAEMQPGVTLLKADNQTPDRNRIGADLSKEPNFALPTLFGYRHSAAGLGNIEANENLDIVSHRSSSYAEDRLAHASNPRSLA
jgi:hypothetical protein